MPYCSPTREKGLLLTWVPSYQMERSSEGSLRTLCIPLFIFGSVRTSFFIMFDDTARMLVISWVLFEGVSTTEAARRLVCDRTTAAAWVKAHKDTGEWWTDPAIRNRHADNVLFDEHFVRAVNAVILSDPEQLLGEIKDVSFFLSTLPGYRDSYKCSIATLYRVLRAAGYSYKQLYRMCRERDQARRAAFAKLFLSVPLRCLVSANETHKDGGDLRRRHGRWLRDVRFECQSRDRRSMLRTSTMMAFSFSDGVLHSVTTPTPPSQNSDDWLIFLNGLLPTTNRFFPGQPWRLQRDRCVLLYDNAPIDSAEADVFTATNGIFPLRLPPYSPELQPIEEVFSEYSYQLKTAHNSYPGVPEALLHAVALSKLTAPNTASHSEHSLLEAVRNVPEFCGPGWPWEGLFASLPDVRD